MGEAAGLAHFEADIGATGKGTIIVNGEDVGDQVVAVELQSRVGNVPTLILYSNTGSSKIRGDGIVKVVTPGMSLVTLIGQIEPKTLEAEALKRQEWGDGKTYTEVVLEVLMEAANAAESQSS